jgi:hypothetical protein
MNFSLRKQSIAKQFLFVSMTTIALILLGVVTYMIHVSIRSKNEQYEVMTNGRSSGVIEKIDRNFYERFGDVQAFAVNVLAVKAAQTDSSSSELQKFMNTMVSYYVLYDLMVVCDLQGNVLAANTIDKNSKPIATDFMIGKNFSSEEWFKTCTTAKGPEGGAWYSDFIENKDVSTIYSRMGWGMAFAAPIKDNEGAVIGVWYNFANWDDVTVGIRKETEDMLKKSIPGSFVIVTNEKNQVIDCDEPALLLNQTVSVEGIKQGDSFLYEGNNVNSKNYAVGGKQGTGAYIFKGKNWHAITFVPKTKFSLAYVVNNLAGFIGLVGLLFVVIGILFFKLASTISINLEKIKKDVEQLATGELVEVKDTTLENEIGAMTLALKTMVHGMSNTAQFAKQIGEGNLTINFQALSEKDVLGNSLLLMRNNLLKIKEEDQRREWATNGIAKIGEILRSDFKQASDLYDSVLRFVVKFSGSNQGGLFLINEDAKQTDLTLVACYAYERKKYLQKTIDVGEGLVGQCFLEKEMIYMTQVPKNYISITSGLGDVAPSALIVLPLKINDVIVGVLELASLKMYEPHEQSLLQKFAESIASTVSAVRINERTKLLLEQSQQQAEEMRSQEEEMRQNMEELTATQEEMARKEREYIDRIAELEK